MSTTTEESIVFKQLLDEPLTVEQERHYAGRIKRRKGDREAINFLIEHSLREAVLYLRELSKHQVEDGELVSVSYKALDRAARNFDPNRGELSWRNENTFHVSGQSFELPGQELCRTRSLIHHLQLGAWTALADTTLPPARNAQSEN